MKKRDRLYQLAHEAIKARPPAVKLFRERIASYGLERTLAVEFLNMVASREHAGILTTADRHPDTRASPCGGASLGRNDRPQTNNGASQPMDESHDLIDRPTGPSTAMKAGAAKVALRIADTFLITERQGSRTPIGDIPVHAYPRLINALGKRTWVSSREYNTICLLKGHADTQAHIPQEAKTRDVFSDTELTDIIRLAQSLATPQIEKNPEIIDA